jgi:cellulose synthase/poly-beta-1,6-N-acetylglucosamine synthase-like glycosyltransferase
LEILRGPAAQAGLALAIVGRRKKDQQPRNQGQHCAGDEFTFQTVSDTPIMEAYPNYSRQFSSPAQRTQKTLVSAIIPARNEEASIARAVESVAAQPEVEEVIVVNDQSRDRTAGILAQLMLSIPKLRVLETRGLPSGWTGKNYALSMGVAAAHGDWLLFTDADTYHLPGSTQRALADASENKAALVSYSPEQEMETFWERALIPFVYCRLAARFSFARVNNPDLPDAASNGQFLLIRRDVYESVGGHAGVASEILEDVALARRVKHSGNRIYFTAPVGVVRTRMYRTFGAMWQGWTKNLYPLMGGSFSSVLRELCAVFPWATAAVLALFYPAAAKAHDLLVFTTCCIGLFLAAHAMYAAQLYRNLFGLRYVQYYVPGACLYSAALIASWWKNTRGSVVWKGRTYPSKAPRTKTA